MPSLPDHSEDYERAGRDHPYKLVCPPARSFLNTTFTETATSRTREGEPRLRVAGEMAAREGIADGSRVRIGNARGAVTLTALIDEGLQPDTLVAEGIWQDESFADGVCLNHLIGDDPVPPNGGVAFHDVAVLVGELLHVVFNFTQMVDATRRSATVRNLKLHNGGVSSDRTRCVLTSPRTRLFPSRKH